MVLLYKVQCFIRISGTDNTDNLTCEIIYDNFPCENYHFPNNYQSLLLDILYWWKTCSLYNKRKSTWVLGNTRFISRVEHDISHSFAALTREISCSTLEINLVFPRTHVLFSI